MKNGKETSAEVKKRNPGRFWEGLTITVHNHQADPVINFLFERGYSGVETIDKEEGFCEIISYIPKDRTLDEELDAVANFVQELTIICPELPPGKVGHFKAEDERWAENWKQYFKPIKVGPRLVVRPSWEDYVAAPEEKVMIIDPGMAFGTGQHSTTVLCLEALQHILEKTPKTWKGKDVTMLDVGCGTGILALAAVILGAGRALALDNDPVAVEATGKNAALNRLEDKIEVRLGDAASVQDHFLVIAANIQLHPLIEMAQDLTSLLDKYGMLILSGILHDQEDELVHAFKDLTLKRRRRSGEWACLEMQAG